MNLDEIEDLIRRYLSAGITVVIILVAPATGGTDEELTPAGEPSVVTIEPDRPDLDDTSDPRVRDVPDEDEAPDPADGERSPVADPSDTAGPDQRQPADDTEEDGTPTRDDPADADPTPSRVDPDAGEGDDPDADDPDADDRETVGADDPAVDQEESRDDETDDTSTVDERPADNEEQADEEPVEREPADEDAADRDASDAQADDSDLESRGPADGSEPGIDDERATEAGDDTASTSREAADSAPGSAVEGTTAAERYGWGTPDQEDDFGSGLAQWDLYEGPGHAGEGQRSPDAVTVQDGVLTITGDAEGTTGGMAWAPGQRYGRWEGRVRAPASDPSYNALLLLWPDAEDFPEGGEIDFMEMLDPTRQSTEFFLHHGPDNDQVTARVEIDGTEWHNWAVEWTPDEIVGYVDGEEWFRTTDTALFPPGPMHLCIQLDWFPDGGGEVQESTMEVDWVRQYTLEPAGDQPDREVASTGPASVAAPAEPADDPLRRMFSWS